MTFSSAILLILLVGVATFFIIIYNRLVALQNNVKKSYANISVLLEQRHDELPKLIESCKQYMTFESQTLTDVMVARGKVYEANQSGNVKALGLAEGALRNGLGSLLAVSEKYPDLKANEDFQRLIARISELESDIADRREYYNNCVNLNNVRMQEFPNNLVVGIFGFELAHMLDFKS